MFGLRRSAVLFFVLAACAASDDTPPMDAGSGGEGGSRGTDDDPGDSAEAPGSYEELEELCESQTERAGCEGAEGFVDGASGTGSGCVWETQVPVSLGDDGACVFGEATGRCTVDTVSGIGCASGGGVACLEARPDVPSFGGVRQVEGGVGLVEAEVCIEIPDTQPCDVDADGIALEGSAPECACMCDPAWPG